MDKSKKRAVRRHHIARLKKGRKHYWGYPNRWAYKRDELPCAPQEMDARQLGKVVQYPKACSCGVCCNVRRAPYVNQNYLTRQEQRHWQNYREGLSEVDKTVLDKEED